MKKYSFALLLSIALVAVPAQANYSCSGTVTYLGLSSGGVVTVAGPGGLTYVYVCTLGVNANGWTADACKAAYATLLGAKLSGQVADIFFLDTLTCTTQPAWSTATLGNIYHVATQ
jgi:hypothetical protein